MSISDNFRSSLGSGFARPAPVMAVYGSYYPALGGNVANGALYAMKILAQNVRGILIPNSGHWGPEERPDFVVKMLDNFFGGNPAETSK